MPVETIECQIVQAQLGRYLSGESFSHEAMRQLEDHIADCQICRQEVAVRRASLQSLLGPSTPEAGRPEALIGALRESQAASTKTIPTHAVVEQVVPESVSLSPKRFSKPAMFGSALAVVLIAMSYIGRNPTSIFGGRAAESTTLTAPAATVPAPAAALAPAPAAEPLTFDEWSAMGLTDVAPFDSTDAGTLEPWAWFALSESLREVQNEQPDPETTPELVVNPVTTPVKPEPDALTSNVPAVAQPRPTTKPRARSKVAKPQVAPKSNTIRIYEPGQ